MIPPPATAARPARQFPGRRRTDPTSAAGSQKRRENRAVVSSKHSFLFGSGKIGALPVPRSDHKLIIPRLRRDRIGNHRQQSKRIAAFKRHRLRNHGYESPAFMQYLQANNCRQASIPGLRRTPRGISTSCAPVCPRAASCLQCPRECRILLHRSERMQRQKLLCALQRGQPIQKAGASAQRGPSRFGQARCVVRQATSNVCRINSIVCRTASGSAGGIHNPAVNWYSFHNRDGLVRRRMRFARM